jgi:hypothetical protein
MKYSHHHLVAAALLLASPASLSGFQLSATPLIRNQHTLLKTSRDIRFSSLKSSSGPASTTRLQMSDATAAAPDDSEAPEEEKKGFMGKVCHILLYLTSGERFRSRFFVHQTSVSRLRIPHLLPRVHVHDSHDSFLLVSSCLSSIFTIQ